MERFTKTEITWLIGELDKLATEYRLAADKSEHEMERGMAHLRSEQLSGISDRLDRAVKNGDKRIEIAY